MFNDSHLSAKYLGVKEMPKKSGLFATEWLSSLIGPGIRLQATSHKLQAASLAHPRAGVGKKLFTKKSLTFLNMGLYRRYESKRSKTNNRRP